MKAEIAKKWVRALRSKKYRQAKGVLKITGKSGVTRHCCLGVLCELYQQEQRCNKKPAIPTHEMPGQEASADLPKRSCVTSFGKDENFMLLPSRVQKWAGLKSDNGYLFNDDVAHDGSFHSDLATLNDAGMSFAGIADVIEDNVKLL